MTSIAQRARRPLRLHPYARTALLIAAVGLAGFVVGGVTSPAQQSLPDAVHSVANSSSGWTLAAFALVWLSRLRPLAAAYAGALALVLMVEGYGVVSALRGFPNGPPLEGMFTIAGLALGPVVGASASILRYGGRMPRALAIAPLAVVLVGEGVYGLTVIAGTTSPVYWTAVIALGVAFTGWQLVRQRSGPLRAASVIALVAVGAALFWLVYRLPLTLLF